MNTEIHYDENLGLWFASAGGITAAGETEEDAQSMLVSQWCLTMAVTTPGAQFIAVGWNHTSRQN